MFVDLIKLLLSMGSVTNVDQKSDKDKLEKYWNAMINHQCTQRCLRATGQIFAQFVPLGKLL